MAAIVANGCVDGSKIVSPNKQHDSNGIEGKLLNGKVNKNKNGYVKSKLLSNGDTVSRYSFIF